MSFEALSLIEIDHLVYQGSSLSKKKIFQWRQVKWIQTRNKQDLQMKKMKNHLFFIDRMANTVSGPSQAPIHLAEMSPSDFYIMNVLMREMHSNVQLHI